MTKWFFDVGASIGQTLEFLAQGKVPNAPKSKELHIVCYEPSPRHFSTLIETAERLQSQFAAITLATYGLGGSTRSAQLYEKTQWLADSFDANFRVNRAASYNVISALHSVSTEIVLRTLPEDKVWLKLDTEGSEYEILARLATDKDLLGRIERIYVEWHAAYDRLIAKEQHDYQRVFGGLLERWPF